MGAFQKTEAVKPARHQAALKSWRTRRTMSAFPRLVLPRAKWMLSEDGNTLDDDFTLIQPNGSKFNVYYVYKRTAGGPGFDGTWESRSETVKSVFELQIRPYESDGLCLYRSE